MQLEYRSREEGEHLIQLLEIEGCFFPSKTEANTVSEEKTHLPINLENN